MTDGSAREMPGDDELMFARPSQARLMIHYEGEALDNHEIDSEDLAAALFGLGKAVKITQRTVDPKSPEATVKIRALQEGSFDVVAAVDVPGLLQQTLAFFGSEEVSGVVNAKDIAETLMLALAIVVGRRRRGDSSLTVKGKNGEVTAAGDAASILAENPAFLDQAAKIIDPVDGQGIESVTIQAETGRDEVTQIRMDENDKPAFGPPPELLDVWVEERVHVEILSIALDDGKWRVYDGESAYSVVLEDEEFRWRIDRREVIFRKNDTLIVRMRVEQGRTKTGRISTKRYVERVFQHRSAGSPPTFFD